MSEKIVLIGGGGHAKVVIDCIQAEGNEVIGVLDDALDIGSKVLGVPVVGRTDDYAKFKENSFVIAIGDNRVRKTIAEKMQVKWHTAIHPSAEVSRYSEIGCGTVIMPKAVVNAGSKVGKHCIINTGSVVEHDDCICDFAHISPAATLGGTVKIGFESHVGIGATVKNNISVSDGCVIGAGAVVVCDIDKPGVYIGVPAKEKK